MIRFPSKVNALKFIAESGIQIGTVLDVGVHAETIELRQTFPWHRHVLFEPATEFYESIRRNYAGMDYELVEAAVSDNGGKGRLRKFSIDGRGVSHSTLTGDEAAADAVSVPTIRLDEFCPGRHDPRPYLLKIDVDGYEMPILRGAEAIFPDVAAIIIEATRDTLIERLNFIGSRGFRLFDIVDQCYYFGVISQVDLIFLSNDVMMSSGLLAHETQPFSWEGWVPMNTFEQLVQDQGGPWLDLRGR